MQDAIWINAGEASGDMHAALLARELKARRPDLALTGMGGPAMAEAGVDLSYGMELVSSMGFTEVFSTIPRFLRLLKDIRHSLERTRPKAVVVIDCPELNFRVGKIAHSLGIPAYYYVCPQVWAWRTGRVRLFRRHFRKALCVLPFEQAWYAARGAEAEYVGNPLLDQIPLDEVARTPVEPDLIGLLPGSRRKEIRALMPEFAGVAQRLTEQATNRGRQVRFRLFPAPGVDPAALLAHWPEGVDVDLAEPADRYRAMRSCRFLMAASGTVALEAALVGVPTIVCYRLSALTYFLTQRVVQVKFASLPNLILGREVFPERFQEAATAEPLARLAGQWLEDGPLDTVKAGLEELRRVMGEPGAPGRAADIILRDLDSMDKGAEK